MSNVVTSQPRQEAKINSKELPSSEINCERCRKDDDQCCFVYFYSLYCNQWRCSGCCDEEKQKRRSPQRRGVNHFTSDRRPQRRVVNYYGNDNHIMFNDDDITRGFLYDDNGFIHTYSDHRQNDNHEYGEPIDNNYVGHSEGGDHLRDIGSQGHVGSARPSGTSGGNSWEHSKSGGYLGVSSGGEGHCVSGGHAVGGDDSDMHSWDRDDPGCKSEGNNAGGDATGDCGGGDTGGDGGGGDTGGGDTWGDCGGGDTGGDCGGGDTGGDCGGGDTGGDCGGGGD
ncbi:glycine-rich cell wall structural protein-like isoform X3 [Maniola jurtina]|uniref:glycine-rich cell wall structural protein-like isoform X2 n=1 Tax=Maniola jurtina TaxID=191418 RepID=UPI001E68A7DF|nr:glycine-rich cell wall structural protein-like isoform X2 [Maniola jurtina]XP_045780331.1 glycine-rich cell wall structural protein-like isoform X3 [Maniola jurtina]